MTDFIHFIYTDFIQCIKEIGKAVIELTCVNIMKYIPVVQGVDEAVNIGALFFLLIPDDLKTQKCVTRQCVKTQQYFFWLLIVLKRKRCVKKPSKMVLGT